MGKQPSLGDQEMELLRYVSENSPTSVREAAAHFEKARGLARTTVLTVMERLRKKGFLSRKKVDGIFLYSAQQETKDVVGHKISEFIERTLGGAASPLFSYFLNSSELTEKEMSQLQEIAAKIDRKKQG